MDNDKIDYLDSHMYSCGEAFEKIGNLLKNADTTLGEFYGKCMENDIEPTFIFKISIP